MNHTGNIEADALAKMMPRFLQASCVMQLIECTGYWRCLCLRLFTERESKLGTIDGDDSSPRGLRDPTESQLWDLS